MPFHVLTCFEIQKFIETNLNLRVPIQEIVTLNKDCAYVINPDDYRSIGTHWIALYVDNDNVTYFDGFGFEYIPKEI